MKVASRVRLGRASALVWLVAAGCGSEVVVVGGAGGGGAGGDGGSGAGGAGGAAGGAGGGTGGIFGGAGGAPPDCSPPCAEGETCVAGECCQSPCGGAGVPLVCCSAGQLCSFQQCVTPGAECVDAADCPPDSICDYSLSDPPMGGGGGMGGACSGGVAVQTGKCMPKPPECPDGVQPGDPPSCLVPCEYKPPTQDFDVSLKYAWGGQTTPPYSSDVMMTPIVVQLDDDDCNGKIDGNDIPEIVFSTFTGGGYFKQGTLHAISIVEGQVVEKLTLPNLTQPGAGLAAADLDGDGSPEIVGCANPGPAGASCCDALALNTGVFAIRADGTPAWTQADTSKVHCGYEAPAIGDVDGDGKPDLVGNSGQPKGNYPNSIAWYKPPKFPRTVFAMKDAPQHCVVPSTLRPHACWLPTVTSANGARLGGMPARTGSVASTLPAYETTPAVVCSARRLPPQRSGRRESPRGTVLSMLIRESPQHV